MLTTRSLNTTLDRMLTLNRALDEAVANARERRVWVPAMDLAEKNDAYLVHLELAGVDRGDIEITLEQNVLTVRGTRRAGFDPQQDGELRVYANERVSGAFERSLRLPEFVDGEAITAEFVNGLLAITIPKAKAAQARRIELR